MAKILATLALWPFATVWRGYVIMHLWRWFVEPFGIQPIGIAWAAGLSLIISFLTFPARVDDESSFSFVAIKAALAPGMVLGFGYVIAGFMP